MLQLLNYPQWYLKWRRKYLWVIMVETAILTAWIIFKNKGDLKAALKESEKLNALSLRRYNFTMSKLKGARLKLEADIKKSKEMLEEKDETIS